MGDSTKFRDFLDIGLSTEVVAPLHPCPSCSRETKYSGLDGWHICTDCDNLRVYVGLTETQHLQLLEDLTQAKARVQQFEVMYKQADKELTDALRILRDRGLI